MRAISKAHKKNQLHTCLNSNSAPEKQLVCTFGFFPPRCGARVVMGRGHGHSTKTLSIPCLPWTKPALPFRSAGPLAILGHPQGFSIPSPSPVSSGVSSFGVLNLDVASSPPYHVNTAPGELRAIDHTPDFTRLPGDGEGPIPGPSLATHWPGLTACSGVKPQPLLTLGTLSGTVCGFSVTLVMSDSL